MRREVERDGRDEERLTFFLALIGVPPSGVTHRVSVSDPSEWLRAPEITC